MQNNNFLLLIFYIYCFDIIVNHEIKKEISMLLIPQDNKQFIVALKILYEIKIVKKA